MVGVFITALYGTDLRSAAAGIVLGNVLGFGLLGVLALAGPAYGVPQMVASRLAFGRRANALPAALSFLAGVGWFAINTVFGAYALETISGIGYAFALALMLALQVVLAVYGYNLIHVFERWSAWLLAAGFVLLGIATLPHAAWRSPFDTHAPLAFGGVVAGFIFATALSFSYATGWIPCAADYARYLPRTSNPRAVWFYSFAGCALPCIVLQIMGAATVTASHADLSNASPTGAIAQLLGSGVMAKLVLATVVLGTLTSNCMNLYSGALAALVAFNVRVRRALAAVVVGVIGALLASGGGRPAETAQVYTNFLLLLSYWASPWAAVVLVDALRHRGVQRDPQTVGPWRSGFAAWLIGLLASIPFWNQALYQGSIAHALPQLGDISYYVGFIVAAASAYVFGLLSHDRVDANSGGRQLGTAAHDQANL